MSLPIVDFRGQFFFLSNFWLTPITVKGETYKSVEHAYQALKTDDPDWHNRIKNAYMPVDARRMGRCIPKELVRPEWDDVRLKVMEVLLKIKFSQPGLRQLLLRTEDAEITHVNTWNDTFYGVCRGKGENHLGKLLMNIRHMAQENLESTLPAPAETAPTQQPREAIVTRPRRKATEAPQGQLSAPIEEKPVSLLEMAQGLAGRR